MLQDKIEREVVIAAPRERVWALLTEAEHLGTWFGDAGAEIDLRPGGELVLRWGEHGESHGRVETVDPVDSFAFRWAPFKNPGGVEPEPGNSTLVQFSLLPEGDGTRLRVVESGFASLACSDEQRTKNVSSNTRGWGMELGELQDYAARVAA